MYTTDAAVLFPRVATIYDHVPNGGSLPSYIVLVVGLHMRSIRLRYKFSIRLQENLSYILVSKLHSDYLSAKFDDIPHLGWASYSSPRPTRPRVGSSVSGEVPLVHMDKSEDVPWAQCHCKLVDGPCTKC